MRTLLNKKKAKRTFSRIKEKKTVNRQKSLTLIANKQTNKCKRIKLFSALFFSMLYVIFKLKYPTSNLRNLFICTSRDN